MRNDGWETESLATLAVDVIGGLWGSPPESSRPNETDVLVIRGADFRNWEDRRAVDAAPRRVSDRLLTRRRLRAGDLVLEVSGGSAAQPVGRVLVVDDRAIFEAPKPLICSNFCRRVRLRADVDPVFVARQLQWLYDSGHTERFQTSTTNIRNLQVDDFLNGTAIALPGPELEAEVTAILGATDEKRANCSSHLSAARQSLDRFRQAVIASGCSGRLTAGWREGNRSLRAGVAPALSPQAVANSSGSPNTDDLTEIPDTWAWWSIEAITDKVIDYRGRTPPSDKAGPIPHVRTTQIRDGRINWETDRFVTRETYDTYMTRGIPRCGDVLFTMEAPLGEVGVVDRDDPFSIAQRILLMRPGKRLRGDFLALCLRSDAVRRSIGYRTTGSGVLGIAFKRLRSVLLPIPPTEEQREIVRRATQLLDLAEQLAQHVETASSSVERSGQAILSKAFRGELTSPAS